MGSFEINILIVITFFAASGGCSKEELEGLAEAGVDLAKSNIDCKRDLANDFVQMDEMGEEKRGMEIDKCKFASVIIML